MPKGEVGGLRVRICTDNERGLILCYLGLDSDDAMISTFSLRLMQKCPAAFAAWKDAMRQVMIAANESLGLKVIRTFEERPHEGN